MKTLLITDLSLMAIGSFAVYAADQTVSEKTKEVKNDTKRAARKVPGKSKMKSAK